LGIEEDQEFIVRYDAEYYHSRVDTVIRLLPAPHLEMDLDYLQELQSDGKIFVKYFMIPVGVCEEGLWIRLFDGQTDTTGRLIKLEHDSILGYPATAPREVGRISHIEGNPHFVIRVAVSTHAENGLEFHDANVWDRRSYPHLLETLQAKKATHADEWEKAMRTVTYTIKQISIRCTVWKKSTYWRSNTCRVRNAPALTCTMKFDWYLCHHNKFNLQHLCRQQEHWED
jgi:hypothetical protein